MLILGDQYSMSFGGFGGFAEEESQEVAGGLGKTPTRTAGTYGGQQGEKRIRNIPVTVRVAIDSASAAKDATDLPIIYDVPAKYVEVLGQIESITYDASSLVCLVDDGTGKIHLKQYFEQPIVGEGEESPFAEFTYVSLCALAVGALRTGSDPYVSINQIRKVTSANEIAYHIISVCAAHMDIVEEKDGTFGATPMRSFNKMQTGAAFGQGGGFDMPEVDATPIKTAPASNLSAAQIEDQVYQFVLSGKSTQWGFSKSDCVLKFKSVMAESQVNKAIEQLLDDARIYDTGDEVHFKAIE